MSTSKQTNGKPGHTLVYVHCRGFKPEAAEFGELCRNAIRQGLKRDRPGSVSAFDSVRQEMTYYGDLTRDVLTETGKQYDEALDLHDRKNALAELKAIEKAKKFTLARYDRVPGKTSLKEFAADVASPLLQTVGLSALAIRKLVPELSFYWNPEHSYGPALINRVASRLRSAMLRGDNIMVVSHGIGSIAVYDALWHLSHDPQRQVEGAAGKVESWVTLGSPLGNETIRRKLAGAKEKGAKRYPGNIISWDNVAAEDDYMSHDKTVADDFRPMLKSRLVSRINDHKVYNLALRYGRSNPHSSVGYLIHPRTVDLISAWLPKRK